MVGKWDRIGGGITFRTDILVGNRHKVSKCVPWPLTCVTRCVNGLSFCFQSPPHRFFRVSLGLVSLFRPSSRDLIADSGSKCPNCLVLVNGRPPPVDYFVSLLLPVTPSVSINKPINQLVRKQIWKTDSIDLVIWASWGTFWNWSRIWCRVFSLQSN